MDVTKEEPQPGKNYDLIILDYHNFTLNRWGYWGPSLRLLGPHAPYLIITESACYGFAMGNLQKTYGVQTPKEYYDLLDKRCKRRIGKRVQAVVNYGGPAGGCALVLLGPIRGDTTPVKVDWNKHPVILPSDPLKVKKMLRKF